MYLKNKLLNFGKYYLIQVSTNPYV